MTTTQQSQIQMPTQSKLLLPTQSMIPTESRSMGVVITSSQQTSPQKSTREPFSTFDSTTDSTADERTVDNGPGVSSESNSPSDGNNSIENNDNVAVIVGSALGGLCFVILIIGGLLFFARKRNHNNRDDGEQNGTAMENINDANSEHNSLGRASERSIYTAAPSQPDVASSSQQSQYGSPQLDQYAAAPNAAAQIYNI